MNPLDIATLLSAIVGGSSALSVKTLAYLPYQYG